MLLIVDRRRTQNIMNLLLEVLQPWLEQKIHLKRVVMADDRQGVSASRHDYLNEEFEHEFKHCIGKPKRAFD